MTHMWPMILAFFLALTGAAVLTPFARKLSWHFGFLDQPAARKVHRTATPLLGGAALGGGMLLGLAGVVAMPPRIPTGWGTAMGLVVALGLGLWDDRRGLGPVPK